MSEIRYTEPKSLASAMIAGLDCGRHTGAGDRCSDYFCIARDDSGREATVALIENKAYLEQKAWYFTVHMIDDIHGTDCRLADGEDLSMEGLARLLVELADSVAKDEKRYRQSASFWFEGPWRNDSCKGYAIMAMERAGLDVETIRKVSSEMTWCFDDTTVGEAARYYMKGAVR